MASTNNVAIKQEYSPQPLPQAAPAQMSPTDPQTLKRQRSDEGHNGEKRQRIEVGSDLNTLLERAAADAVQRFQQSKSNQQIQTEAPPIEHQTTVANGANPQAATTMSYRQQMCVRSLPLLENLSTQLLSILAQGDAAIRIFTTPKSEQAQGYATIKALFDGTRKIYAPNTNEFLSSDVLNLHKPADRFTINATNLATFTSSVFGGTEIGFYELNEKFLDAFTPDGTPLRKEHAMLCLSLKTQVYISAISDDEHQEQTKEDLLEDLFPDTLDKELVRRHVPPTEVMTENEYWLVQQCAIRRDYLMKCPNDIQATKALGDRFPWEDFLKSLSSYLRTLYEPLTFLNAHAERPQVPPQPKVANQFSTSQGDIALEAEKAAQMLLNNMGFGKSLISTTTAMQNPATGNSPFPNPQDPPLQELYDQARQAIVSKSQTTSSKKPGLVTQRRPWTRDEEQTLMDGIDHFQGPHWSKILELYGPNGSVNEVLKDRNQVQLKDKARNLKLFFLKNGTKVPKHLDKVTGELRTRAPGQLARRVEREGLEAIRSEGSNGLLQDSNGDGEMSRTQSPELAYALDSPENENEPQIDEEARLRQSLLAVSDELQPALATT